MLPDKKGIIKDIVIRCHRGIVSQQELSCEDGDLSLQETLVNAMQSKLIFSRKENGNLNLSVGQFKLANGLASFNLQINKGRWDAKIYVNGFSLATLSKTLPSFPKLVTSGMIVGDLNLSGVNDSLDHIQGDLLINKFGFSNNESTLVGEDVATKLIFSSSRHDNRWRTQLDSTTHGGELYLDPIFIDANESAKDLYGEFDWQIGSNQVKLIDLQIEDPHSMHVILSTEIDFSRKIAVAPMQVKVSYALFPNVYYHYIQPFLFDTNAADLATKGSLSGEVVVNDLRISQADLELNHLSLVDNQNRFSLVNLNGSVGWGSQYANKNYSFGFGMADLYKIRLGKSKLDFINQDDALMLTNRVSVPLLDGSINIESFQVHQPGKADQKAIIDISLTPVSMPKLSTSLGWPEMNGNLAGYAPNVIYKKGDIEIGGALLVRGFGGTTTIHNLYAEDIFSITPKLSADVKLTNLDLKSLTETFSFGEITGRLNGRIDDMQFVSWAPVQFDAWFGTPENDKSRHRISQTAVDNLTQVGNGAPNVLSKSFLKFFDSFGYDKLGLGCTLKNNTCKMRGVDGSGNGFYIVKGKGIPRIDIVGFTDEVSWPVLTARLKRVIKTQEVIIN
ncbi:MAG: hypothetical protein AAF304_06295 [Pseudomonadota bacterium]